MYAASANFLTVTGDVGAYKSAFGSSRVPIVSKTSILNHQILYRLINPLPDTQVRSCISVLMPLLLELVVSRLYLFVPLEQLAYVSFCGVTIYHQAAVAFTCISSPGTRRVVSKSLCNRRNRASLVKRRVLVVRHQSHSIVKTWGNI